MRVVILCGGSGTRLWPISRTSTPKQFIPLFGGQSLFQLTINRNLNLASQFTIMVNENQLELCQKQIPASLQDKVSYIIEPCGRNTAPAITLAALSSEGEDLLILPSDHLIKNTSEYEATVSKAQSLSQGNNLVTFSIKPQYPETGYGYIEANNENVVSFKEKPDNETAKKYLAAGNYFWNSGMFLFNSDTYLSEIEEFDNEILTKSKTALANAKVENNIIYINKQDMEAIPSNSIDYAVMEKSQAVKTVPGDFGWSDLGSYDSLFDELPKDENNNTQTQKYEAINSHNNLILSTEDKLISTINIDDLIIVDTQGALLIAKKGEGQLVKELREKVKHSFPELLD